MVETTQITRSSDLLKTRDELVKEMHLKETEEIVIEINTRDSENRSRRKYLHLNARNLDLDQLAHVIADKVQTYLKKNRMVLDSFSVVFSAGGAALGGRMTIPGNIFEVAADAFNKTSQNSVQLTESERTILDFRFKVLDMNSNEYLHQSKQDDQEFDKALRSNDTLLDRLQRLADFIFQRP